MQGIGACQERGVLKSTIQPISNIRAGGANSGGQPVLSGRAAKRGLPRKILNVGLATLKWLAIAILFTLAAALVLLPLIWGPTPLPVSLLLLTLLTSLLALLVVGAARLHSGRLVLAAVSGLVVLALLSVGASQFFAYTPAIVDAQGQPVHGSIATLEQLRLGGSQQWISIRGKSTTNPVLLFLAGGPGGSELATVRHHLGGLEDYFVVVNWEQPGAGKSYHAVDHAQLTSRALYLRCAPTGALPAAALWAAENLSAGRVVGQRIGHLVGEALP